MSMLNLGDVIATLVTDAATLWCRRARLRRNRRVISYLEGMPAYLRDDIGLPQGADIGHAVDSGGTYDAAAREPHRNLAITPHAT